MKTCPHCPKHTYPSKKIAAAVAAQVRREHNEIVNHYRCRHGFWHIGHPEHVSPEKHNAVKERMNRADARTIRGLLREES